MPVQPVNIHGMWNSALSMLMGVSERSAVVETFNVLPMAHLEDSLALSKT